MHTLARTAAAAASGVAMAMSITVATELPANAAAGCQTGFSRYSTVKVGSSGAQVKAAQCLLESAGYTVRADASFSSADARRLMRYQSRHKLRPTGSVDARSWVALLSHGTKPTLHFGDRNGSVARLQRSLTATGRPVPDTGYYGPITKKAVQSLQQAQHWDPTGTASASVWSILQRGGAVRSAGTPAKQAIKSAKKSRPAKRAAKLRSAAKGARVVAFAKRQLGDRYVWGASGPNAWDCSGLTGGAWNSVGVTLPHNAKAQFGRGRKISRADLRPGDLVFFYRGISHVAVYAGNGRSFKPPGPAGRSMSDA